MLVADYRRPPAAPLVSDRYHHTPYDFNYPETRPPAAGLHRYSAPVTHIAAPYRDSHYDAASRGPAPLKSGYEHNSDYSHGREPQPFAARPESAPSMATPAAAYPDAFTVHTSGTSQGNYSAAQSRQSAHGTAAAVESYDTQRTPNNSAPTFTPRSAASESRPSDPYAAATSAPTAQGYTQPSVDPAMHARRQDHSGYGYAADKQPYGVSSSYGAVSMYSAAPAYSASPYSAPSTHAYPSAPKPQSGYSTAYLSQPRSQGIASAIPHNASQAAQQYYSHTGHSTHGAAAPTGYPAQSPYSAPATHVAYAHQSSHAAYAAYAGAAAAPVPDVLSQLTPDVLNNLRRQSTK